MPLGTTTLKNDFKTLMTDMRTREAISDDEFADRFATMMETFVKSGDGVYQNGSLQQSGTVNVVAVVSPIVKIT